MFAAEPTSSQADLHFRVFGFPVRVSPWFWGVSVMLVIGGSNLVTGGGKKVDPIEALVWVAVMFGSILVHELGHAFTQRHFGGRPRIVLYGFGGLAICDDCDRSPSSQILISVAGPAAGFLLAAVVILIVRLSGRRIGFLPPGDGVNFEALGVSSVIIQPLIAFRAYFEPFTSQVTDQLVADLLQINILWGLINLMPIYPLDGGRVSRELFTLSQPRRGIVQSLWLSAGVATAFAVFGLMRGSIFTAFMFGYLAYANYQTLQAYEQNWR
jgi:stage IV sporulation protein FB